MPKPTPRRLAASAPTIWPMRVILNAIFFMPSASSFIGLPLNSRAAARMTPGPETPTFITASPSPGPWKAPAMKGLSSGALVNTTSLAQALTGSEAEASAVFFMVSPISLTASMLIPFLVVPTLTDEQTQSVTDRASGMESIRILSAGVIPFWTREEKPPMKFTPSSLPHLSSVRQYST